jgi:N-acetylmuramoyl-L-alanine amidase
MKNDIQFSSLSEVQVVGLTLFGEARGEPIESIVGVASVIRNRFQLAWMGKRSYSEVCLTAYQFSCWNENDPNRRILGMMIAKLVNKEKINDIFYRQCEFVGSGIINWDLRDNTKCATHYMETHLFHSPTPPTNVEKLVSVAKVTVEYGNHTFFIAH